MERARFSAVGYKLSIRGSLTDEASLVPLLATRGLKRTTFVAAEGGSVFRREAIPQCVERFAV